jgi:hypothetical protein
LIKTFLCREGKRGRGESMNKVCLFLLGVGVLMLGTISAIEEVPENFVKPSGFLTGESFRTIVCEVEAPEGGGPIGGGGGAPG